MNNIQVKKLNIGIGTTIEPTVSIRGIDGEAKSVTIGDYCYIGHNVQIICDEFSIGDYSKIQHNCNIHGYKPCTIGHNLWIGQFSIIDSIGGCNIGNNCGIGAHSQLWSHIKYGDTLEGCRFLNEKGINIGNDVWFVGHCIVSPITAADKSMALVGSVITQNMEYNTIYSGVPAKEISSKIGLQFNKIDLSEKFNRLIEFQRLAGLETSKIRIVMNADEIQNDSNSYFVVSDRKYTKKKNKDEVEFMKFLLPEKAKFIPF